jgi:hypothetical protein
MSTKIQRYDFESGEYNEPLPIMVPIPLGDYVKFIDHETALTSAYEAGWRDCGVLSVQHSIKGE